MINSSFFFYSLPTTYWEDIGVHAPSNYANNDKNEDDDDDSQQEQQQEDNNDNTSTVIMTVLIQVQTMSFEAVLMLTREDAIKKVK